MAIGELLPPVIARLMGDISDFQAKMGLANKEMEKLSKGGADSFTKLAAIGKGALEGTALLALGVGVASIKMADDFEASHARLETAVKNSGNAWKNDYQPAVDAVDKRMESLGFNNATTENALSRLVPVTKSSAAAVKDLALAADIAAARHLDLESATQLVVKVETNHVALLGRLGINIKDAEGNIISQTEALKRLADMYGGQAQAQAETFGGKMKVLAAQAEDLGVKIGMFLIPIITSLGGALADGIGWLEKHKTAAYALAVIIGGPLVAAMAAYVVKQVEAAGSSLLNFWLNAYGAVSALAGETFGLAAAYEAEVAAELQAIGATEAQTAAMLEQTGAAGALESVSWGAVAGIAGIAGVAVGAGLLINKLAGEDFPGLSKALKDGKAAGQDWGNQLIIAVDQLGTGTQGLRDQLVRLHTEAKQAGESLNENGDSFNKNAKLAEYYSTAINRVQEELHKETAAHAEALTAADATATMLGVTLPDSADVSTAQLKAMKTAIADAVPVFGSLGTQALLTAGVTGTQLAAMAKQADTLDKQIATSADGVLNSFVSIGNGAAVSEQEMEKAFLKTAQDTIEWAANMKTLIASGVDQSIVAQFAAAGPKSASALAAFDQMVALHGAAWVNSMYQSGQQAVGVVQVAMGQMIATGAMPIQTTWTVTQIERIQQQFFDETGQQIGGIPHSAGGNKFPYGGLSWVGENGPELRYIPPGGSIIPHGESMAMAGGGDIYVSVTVNAPVGSSPADIGRTLAEYLTEYQRRAGLGWQSVN